MLVTVIRDPIKHVGNFITCILGSWNIGNLISKFQNLIFLDWKKIENKQSIEQHFRQRKISSQESTDIELYDTSIDNKIWNCEWNGFVFTREKPSTCNYFIFALNNK